MAEGSPGEQAPSIQFKYDPVVLAPLPQANHETGSRKMSFRNSLLATTVLVFPVAAEAQMPAEPVTGIYLGAAGGFNIKTNPNINGIETNIPGAAGRATPNASLSTGIGGAASAP